MLPENVRGRVHVFEQRSGVLPCGSFCNWNFNRVDHQTASAPPQIALEPEDMRLFGFMLAAAQAQAAGAQTGAAADLQEPEGAMCVKPYTLFPLEGMDYSQTNLKTYLKSTQGTFPSALDLRHFSTEAIQYLNSTPTEAIQYLNSTQAAFPRQLDLRGFSAMAMHCLLEQLSPAKSRAALAWSGFPDSRTSPGDLVAFRGDDRLQSTYVPGRLEVLQSPCQGAGVHSTSLFDPTFGLESQQRFQTVESRAAENEDKCVRAMASDDSAQAGGGACTSFVECAGCFGVMQEKERVVFVPCGHVCMCHECASQLKTCPMCRAEVQQVVKLFYS
jgi:hypothetical protein